MTKEEVVGRCNELYGKIEDFLDSVEELAREAKQLYRAAEYLPGDVKDIDDTEKEESNEVAEQK